MKMSCSRAFIFAASIVVILFISLEETSAHPAWGIAVDRQGQVYFSDLETVWKINRQGKLSTFRNALTGRHVHDISIDADDNVYGIDNAYDPRTNSFPRAIWKIAATGEFSYIVPMTINLPRGSSVWRDFDGNTYSDEPYNNEKKESKIIKRTPAGIVSLFAGGKYGYRDGKKENAEFTKISDMAFATDKTIYLTTGDKIRKIDRFGTVTTICGRDIAAPTSSTLFGLAVDKLNNVFAADHNNRRVLKISPEGGNTVVSTTEQPWSPTGVAVRGSDLYILENWYDLEQKKSNTRVRKLSTDGKITVLATLREGQKGAAMHITEVESGQISERDKKSSLSTNSVAGVLVLLVVSFIWHGYRLI